MFLGVLYVFLCFILGWLIYKYELVNAELEISNQYNPLAKQLREKLEMPKDLKDIKS